MKLLEKVKVPLDVVLITVVPFVGFLLLFMYLAGLIPAQPIIVEIPGDAVVREMDDGAGPETAAEPGPDAGGPPAAGETVAPEAAPVAEAGRSTPDVKPAAETEPSRKAADESPVDEEHIKRVKQIAKVYDQMNATSVAAIVRSMSDDDAVEILSMMNPRNAARVLAALEPDKAARLSLMLTE
jgi:hypothetical protein